jgi:hypothetical protein
MQFTENVRVNWQEGYCFIMRMPDPIQPEQTREEFKNYGEFLEHPPCSADLAPSDFHLIGPLRNRLSDKHFIDDEVEMEVWKWLRQQSKDFYTAGLDALVKQWDKCINVGGGYVAK